MKERFLLPLPRPRPRRGAPARRARASSRPWPGRSPSGAESRSGSRGRRARRPPAGAAQAAPHAARGGVSWARPRALRPGDLVGVCAPAGVVDRIASSAGSRARADGLPRAGGRRGRGAPPLHRGHGRSAGCADLHALFADDEVAGVLCARGGAGRGLAPARASTRRSCARTPSRSSATATSPSSTSCFNRLEQVTFHGPMVAWELAQGAFDEASFEGRARGRARPTRREPDDIVALRDGEADGRLLGGCLSILAAAARHALGAQAGRGGHDPLPGGRRREAVPDRPDAATAPLVGRVRGRAGHRVRRHEGLLPAAPRRTTRWRTSSARRCRASTYRSRSASPAATPTGPTSRCRSACGRACRCRRRGTLRGPGGRRSHEDPPLRHRGHGHGVAGRSAARARARGHRLRPGRLPADVRPSSRSWASRCARPTRESNVPADADLVVIGNALSRGNPEVEIVLDRKQRMTSLPALLAEEFIRGHDVAGGGRHPRQDHDHEHAGLPARRGRARSLLPDRRRARRTSRAATAWAGARTSWSRATSTTARSSTSGPKFVHYLPDVAVIGNLEYDHADIYPDLAAVQTAFVRLMQMIPRRGLLVAGIESAALREILPRALCRVETFGARPRARTGAARTCGPAAGGGWTFRLRARRERPRRVHRSSSPASTTCATRWPPSRWPTRPGVAPEKAREILAALPRRQAAARGAGRGARRDRVRRLRAPSDGGARDAPRAAVRRAAAGAPGRRLRAALLHLAHARLPGRLRARPSRARTR